MDNVIIKTENLGFTYEDDDIDDSPLLEKQEIPALDGVSLEIRNGEYIAVLGHNGSGKSTFAKLLNLILLPTVGKVYVDGKDVSNEDITDDDVFEVRSKIGMVFQNPDNQLVATVVEEDVAFGPENLGLPREEIRRRVDEALRVVGMTEYKDHAPHKLSGGQKQRVAIAGIIAMKPKVIIFDESTAMLDPQGRVEILDIMENLNREEGITILNITHYMDAAARADRVIVINDGKVAFDGTAKEVFAKRDELHMMGLEAPQGRELIDELRAMGIKLAVLSNKQHAATVALVKKYFGDSFDMVLGGRDGIALKPNPESAYAIYEHFGVTGDECAYVGDSEPDVHMAQNAKMGLPIFVLWGLRSREQLESIGAECFVSEAREISELIKKHNN